MLRLFLVGRVAAEYSGMPLPMPSSERARALMGWLGLHPGLHPRSRVSADLWPDTDAVQGRARLRTTVWALRQAWGEPAANCLAGGRDTIGLAPGVAVDVRQEPEPGQPLAEGELVPEIDDEWAQEAREEYRDRRRLRYRALCEEAGSEGRWADAAEWARRRCALTPFDEAAHRDLLSALVSGGDRAGAAEEARRFAERLRTELGVAPSAATRAVHVDVAAGSAPVRSAPVFGRADEVRTLEAAWRAAASGRGRLLVVTGEPGIGKTTLLRDLVGRVSARGGRVSQATGIDVGGAMPYAAWVDLARGLASRAAPPPPSVRWPSELNRLSDDLGSALRHPELPVGVGTPELERLRIFAASLRLVEWVTADRPVLLVLDDAHRADRASLQLLAHLARRFADLPVLLALAAGERPTPGVDELVHVAGRAGVPVTSFAVGPIDRSAVAALATSLGLSPAQQVEQVIATSEGNPLLATETVRMLLSGDSGPPPNLRVAVRTVTAQLSPDGQRLSALLAAAGRALTPEELDRLGPEAAPAVVKEVIGHGLVDRVDGRLGFRHGLLREAAYVDLQDPTPVHETLANAVAPALSAEIAEHWQGAGRPDKAAEAWRRLAAYARSVGALDEARDALTRALGCVQTADGWLELQEVLVNLGRHEEAEEAWRQGLSRLDGLGRADAWCRRGQQLRSVSCNPPRSWEAYREADRAYTSAVRMGAAADSALRRRIDHGLVWNEALAGDPARAVARLNEIKSGTRGLMEEVGLEERLDLAEIEMQALIRQGLFSEAVAVARAAGLAPDDQTVLIAGYTTAVNTASALVCLGDDEGALEFTAATVHSTKDIPSLQAMWLGSLAHLQARTGRFEEARASLAEQARVVDRYDLVRLAVTANVDAGLVALVSGDAAIAVDRLGQALEGGLDQWRPSVSLSRAEALALAGRLDEATAQLRLALQEPTAAADQPWSLLPRVSFVQALIAAGRGNVEEAVRRLDEAAAVWARLLPQANELTSQGYVAALLDLGRPPVLGLVEPLRELARVEELRSRLVGTPIATNAEVV